MLGLVAAFNDFRTAVVAADEIFKVLQLVTAIGFGEKNIVSTADIFDRFTQNAPGQNMSVSEGICGVNQHDIDMRFEHEILESVIENENIRTEVVNGINTGFYSVFINQNGDILKI